MSKQPTLDFRQEMYNSYVSGFKRENLVENEKTIAHFAKWADYHYLPHFDGLPKHAAILDLGCGSGRMIYYLGSRGFTNVAGVDASAEQIAIARDRGLNAEVGDIFTYLEESPSMYDAMVLIDVVEHMTKSELLQMLRLVRPRLNPGGRIVMQTVNGEGLFPGQIMFGDITHTTVLSAGSWEQLLSASGFGQFRSLGTPPVPRGLKGVLRAIVWKYLEFYMSAIRRIETGKRHRIWTENFISSARKV